VVLIALTDEFGFAGGFILTPFSKEPERQRKGNQKQDIFGHGDPAKTPGGIKMSCDGRNALNFVLFSQQ